MKRKAAVAGYFYPADPDELRRMISGMVDPKARKERAVALVSPHAGFVYSGPVAGAVFSSVVLPQTFVFLGPSHRPIRPTFALMKDGEWETPLGKIRVDPDLAERILSSSLVIEVDASAHADEHSLEVQVPFVQYFQPQFAMVPITVSHRASFEDLTDLGEAVATGIQAINKDALIVASTDMSHYVSREEAKELDFLAIEKVLNLDPKGLYDIVRKKDISMCGFQPTTAALVAARALGAKKAELIKYATSGDRTGDFRKVVAYAGLRIT